MLPSHSSADDHMRKGTKRKHSRARYTSESSQSSQQRRTKHCVQEGRWPDHPLAETGTAQPLLQTLALQLGLCGVSAREVRELGLWVYLQANEVHPQPARDEARTILDTKLEAADMYQHLSFCRKVLPRTQSYPKCKTCYVTSYAPGSMRKGVALCGQKGFTDMKGPPNSAQAVCQNFTQSSLSSMHSIHAGCQKGACAAYNLGRRYVTPSLWKHTLMSSIRNCGIGKRELGAGFFTNGIWTLYGCLGKSHSVLWPQQRRTAEAPEGCCPGPYVTVAPACKTNVQLWLWPAHLMHQADTAATCHMGRQALCPHQLIASSRWTKLESPSGPTLSRPPRRKDTNVWPSSWIGVLNVIRRANRHMHPGLPEAYRPLLHAPCPKQAPLREAARQGMPAHIHQPTRRLTHPKQSSTLRHGQPEHEPTEPAHRHPRSEGAESEATCGHSRARVTLKRGRRMHRLAHPKFVNSCCHVDMSWRAAHHHGGCCHLREDLRHACQVDSGSRIAACCATDTHRAHHCPQERCIVLVFQQPTAHPFSLRLPPPPAVRFEMRSHDDLSARRQLPPQGAYLCTTVSFSCSACRYTLASVHVGSVYCKPKQCLKGFSSHLVHAAGMPEPNAEQPPPPRRGNVEKLQSRWSQKKDSRGARNGAQRSPPVPVAGPLNPAGAGSPGPMGLAR